MINQIDSIIKEVTSKVNNTKEELEAYRLKYLSKKGTLNQLFDQFKAAANDQKKLIGQKLNELKIILQDRYNESKEELESTPSDTKITSDLSLPGDSMELGSRHPISLIKNQINDIFIRLGFTISEGPEIEDDLHNFTALNFPLEHPARDMQDTFFITKEPDILLRTHTSSVQVRVMEKTQPPIRMIMPGRVFRNEAISARSHCFFHQVEGLYIDKNVSFADLKQALLFFAREYFGPET